MERASPVEGSSASRRRASAVVPPLVAAVAGVSFFVLPVAFRPIRMPPGDDAIYWVLTLRLTARFGLLGPQLAARPLFPLVGSAMGTVTGSSAWAIAVAAPMAMAAATGLAGAALAARWGLRRWALAAFAILVAASGIVARLVAGKDENLMALWLMAAALAVPAWSAWSRDAGRSLSSRPGMVAAGALVAVMTMVEWPPAVVFAVIVVAAWGVSWIVGRGNRRAPSSVGVSTTSAPLRSFAIATMAGLAAGALAILLIDRAGPGSGIQNLPPGYRYAVRLRDELSLIWPWLTAGLAALGVAAAWGRERRPPVLGLVCGIWLGGTVAVVAAGWFGAPGPTYRALTVALPVALATSAAAFLPLSRRDRSVGRAGPGRGTRAAAAIVLAAAALVPGVSLWWRAQLGTPTSTGQLAEVMAAVRYADSLPGRTPVVLVASDVQLPFAQSLLYQRMASAVAPPNADSRVLVFVGRARDALAGRPTVGLGADEDRVSRDLFAGDVQRALAAGAPVLSGRELDPIGYQEAVRAGAPTMGGGAVAVTRGPRPSPGLEAKRAALPLPPAWRLLVAALEMLVLFALGGIGWTALTMRGAGAEVRWLLAPAFGAAALALVSFVLVHLGVRPSGWGAWAAVAIVLGASLFADAAVRRQGPGPAPEEPAPVAPSPLQ